MPLVSMAAANQPSCQSQLVTWHAPIYYTENEGHFFPNEFTSNIQLTLILRVFCSPCNDSHMVCNSTLSHEKHFIRDNTTLRSIMLELFRAIRHRLNRCGGVILALRCRSVVRSLKGIVSRSRLGDYIFGRLRQGWGCVSWNLINLISLWLWA